ncbi:MAG: hypothetical protein ACI9JZ_002572, partial [Lentimonas sp.]
QRPQAYEVSQRHQPSRAALTFSEGYFGGGGQNPSRHKKALLVAEKS